MKRNTNKGVGSNSQPPLSNRLMIALIILGIILGWLIGAYNLNGIIELITVILIVVGVILSTITTVKSENLIKDLDDKNCKDQDDLEDLDLEGDNDE